MRSAAPQMWNLHGQPFLEAHLTDLVCVKVGLPRRGSTAPYEREGKADRDSDVRDHRSDNQKPLDTRRQDLLPETPGLGGSAPGPARRRSRRPHEDAVNGPTFVTWRMGWKSWGSMNLRPTIL